jgi:hypothetical protein
VSGRPPGTVQGWARVGVTIAFVVVPFAGLAVAVWLACGHGLNLADILLALAFYVITGLGVTVGFHRLLTHRSFTAVPTLRVALAIAGSMSFEGEVIGWVAIHRRHHAFTDRPADAFPLPLRQQPGRAAPRPRARPHGLAAARRSDPARAVRPGHGGRSGHAGRFGRVPCPVRCLPGPAVRDRLPHLAARTGTYPQQQPSKCAGAPRSGRAPVGVIVSRDSGFAGEICETDPERTVMPEGNAQFLGSRVFAMPGG